MSVCLFIAKTGIQGLEHAKQEPHHCAGSSPSRLLVEAVDHKSTWNQQQQILQKDDVWEHEFTNRQWAPQRRCHMHDQQLDDSGETFGASWDISDKRIQSRGGAYGSFCR